MPSEKNNVPHHLQAAVGFRATCLHICAFDFNRARSLDTNEGSYKTPHALKHQLSSLCSSALNEESG